MPVFFFNQDPSIILGKMKSNVENPISQCYRKWKNKKILELPPDLDPDPNVMVYPLTHNTWFHQVVFIILESNRQGGGT